MKRNTRRCILLSFVLSAFFFSGCSAQKTDVLTPESPVIPVEVEKDTIGNTNSNIQNGGHSVLYKDWIYFLNFTEDNHLYRMKTDGTEESLVIEDTAYLLNASGEWIYYSSGNAEGKIFRIRPDGSERSLVSDVTAMNMMVSEDLIYFINYSVQDGSDMFKLFSIRTDGNDKKKIMDDRVSSFSISEEWIYYLKEGEQKIYRVKKDGTENTKISDLEASTFTIHEKAIYYTAYPNDSGLHRMAMDGTGDVVLTEDLVGTMNVSREWICYVSILREASVDDEDKKNSVEEYELKKMRLDGTDTSVLEHLETFSIGVSGDWLVYALYDESSHSVHQTLVKTDGTGRKSFTLVVPQPGENVEVQTPQEAFQAGDLTLTVNSAYSTNTSLWTADLTSEFDELMVDGALLFINMTVINEGTQDIDLENMTGVTIGDNTFIGQYADLSGREDKNEISFHLPLEEYKSSMLLKPGEKKEIQMYCSPNERAYPMVLDIFDSSNEILARTKVTPDEEYYVPTSDDALLIMKEKFLEYEIHLLGQRIMDDEGRMYYSFELRKSPTEDHLYYLLKRNTKEIFIGVPDKEDPDFLRLGDPVE